MSECSTNRHFSAVAGFFGIVVHCANVFSLSANVELLRAVFHKILALRTDDFLIDRLLQTIETGLSEAQLHLVPAGLAR